MAWFEARCGFGLQRKLFSFLLRWRRGGRIFNFIWVGICFCEVLLAVFLQGVFGGLELDGGLILDVLELEVWVPFCVHHDSF